MEEMSKTREPEAAFGDKELGATGTEGVGMMTMPGFNGSILTGRADGVVEGIRTLYEVAASG